MAHTDPSSWVDSVTNFASIGGIELRRDFRDLIRGQYPLSFLPTFLHELTHHWCFQSPVGAALAILRFATIRYSLTRNTGDSNAQYDLVEKMIRFETATSTFRPLSEGLSLFAEFDLRPGRQNLVTLPMKWVSVFATAASADGATEDELTKALARARLQPAVVRNKTNLLVHPLDIRYGGYLPGYMFIKNLWRHLLHRSDRFQDRDFLMCYLRSYFYEDLGLVNVILDPSTIELGSYAAILNHFQLRLHRLLQEANLEVHLEEFERDVLENPALVLFGSSEPPHGRRGILSSDNEVNSGRQRYADQAQELQELRDDHSLDNMLREYYAVSLERRHILCLAREKVSVRRNGPGGHVICEQDGSLLCLVPALDGVGQFAGEGTLAYLMFVQDGKWAVSVTHDQQVVGCSSGYELTQKERLWVQTYATDDATFVHMVDAIDERLNSILTNSGAGILWESFVAVKNKEINEFYTDFATANVPGEKLAACTQALATQGFWDLLGHDLDHVNAYAMMGLSTSLNLTRKTLVEQLLSTQNLSLDQLLSDLPAYSHTYGLTLVHQIDDMVIAVF